MKALLCKQFGLPESLVLEEINSPVLGAREVRIAVRAAGLNFADTLMIAGLYQLKPPLPFSPGMEIAGVVVEVGPGVTRVRKGDRVMATCFFGGFAEERCVSEDTVLPILDEVSFVTAAALPITYGTTYHALTDRADLKPGEWLLAHAAGSGVGLNAVELGKLLGARSHSVLKFSRKASAREELRRRGDDRLLSRKDTRSSRDDYRRPRRGRDF